MKTTAQDKLKAVIEKMINKIENKEIKQWFKPWNGTIPANFSTKKTYRGFNVAMLWFIAEEMEYTTNSWLTFKQIKALKGTVKKGEKSTPIFFYKPLKIEDKETGEEKTIPMLKMYYVFNLDQTEGIDYKTVSENVQRTDIEAFVANTGATIKQAQEAFYSPSMDFVGMPSLQAFISENHYYSTLLHELSHWTGHSTRLDRGLTGRFGDDNYAFEELIAESSAALLGASLGIDHNEMRHEAYLESWLKVLKAEPKILWKVFSQSQKVFDHLTSYQNQQEAA